MDDNDYGRKFCSRCDTYRGYVCAEHREPSYTALTARLAAAEAREVEWKRNPMDVIARARGWLPLKPGEKMTVHFDMDEYVVIRSSEGGAGCVS